jgi:hypothetical protein
LQNAEFNNKRAIPVLLRVPLFLLGAVVLFSFCLCQTKTAKPYSEKQPDIRGVRFDPSYYYNLNQPIAEYVDSLCRLWQSSGVNTVYFKAYDPGFGAVYKTSYAYNRMTDYGKKDFMEVFLKAVHRYNIRLIAWLPVLEHKGTWDDRKEWRVKNRAGSDLMPFPNRYFLCSRRPDVQKWWLGFIEDLLGHYPDIDGIDFAEPEIIWNDRMTCSCAVCKRDFGADAFSPSSANARARAFADLLARSCALAHSMNRTTCVTVIPTADRKGNLLPLSEQKIMTGLDIDRLLDSPMHPDWISCEVLWQQWANTYHDSKMFKPDWTRNAVEQARLLVAGRARFIAHVELSPIGAVAVNPAEFRSAMTAAGKGGAHSIEFYDAHLADTMKAWEGLATSWPDQSSR